MVFNNKSEGKQAFFSLKNNDILSNTNITKA